MQTLSRGQKVKLLDLTSSPVLKVETRLSFQQSTLDFSCFGLDEHNKLSNDKYMIFYNQMQSPEGAIRIESNSSANPQHFIIDITKLPAFIHKLVFVGTIDGQGSMSAMNQGGFSLYDLSNQKIADAEFKSADYSTEKAVMMLEIYKKDNVWRVSHVGQGFADGLSGVLKFFGGEEDSSSSTKTNTPTQQPIVTQSSSTSTPPKLSLTKITLSKRGDSQKIDLSKRNSNQPIHINLNWLFDDNRQKASQSQQNQSRGFFGSIMDALTNPQSNDLVTDLDLGCMFELKNGDSDVIQALGGNFGNKSDYPYIYLDKDDRSGQATDGENMYIYRPDLIKRIMIFAFIYQGSSLFKSVQAKVVIKDGGSHEITVELDNPDNSSPFCSICLIENINNEIKITKEERYFRAHPNADDFYGFGFNWTRGSK